MSYVECNYAECHFAECHFAECHFAECHFAECHYAECRMLNVIMLSGVAPNEHFLLQSLENFFFRIKGRIISFSALKVDFLHDNIKRHYCVFG